MSPINFEVLLAWYEIPIKTYELTRYGAPVQEYNLLFSARNALTRSKLTIINITLYILIT